MSNLNITLEHCTTQQVKVTPAPLSYILTWGYQVHVI